MTGPLRIVHVLEKTSATTGSVVQMLEAVRGLAARGHRVGVVTRSCPQLQARVRDLGGEVFGLPLRHPLDVTSALRLRRIVRSTDTDVVHVHKGTAHAVALLACTGLGSRPTVVVNRGVSFPLDVFNRWKFLHPRVSAIVCVAEAVRQVVIDSTGARSDRVVTVHAGVDVDHFDPGAVDSLEVRRELGLAPEQPLVIQVSIRDWKGWRELVRAFAPVARDLPAARLLLVGCGGSVARERVHAEARSAAVGDRVLTLPFRRDMPEVLAAADVVVDASWAGTGITGTIREAMAMERSVIATDCGGNRELVIDAECGCVVPPRDTAALTTALKCLLTDPDLRHRYGAAARRRVVESFSSKRRIDRLEALYADILRKP